MNTVIREKLESYEAAVDAAYRDLTALRARVVARNALPGDDRLELQLLDLIRALAAMLGDLRKNEASSRKREPREENLGRVSETHDAILKTIPKRQRWTSKEVRDSLEDQGIGAPAKVVTNCLDYFVRTKRLRRISRGVYYNTEYGVGVVSEDLGDEPTRNECD